MAQFDVIEGRMPLSAIGDRLVADSFAGEAIPAEAQLVPDPGGGFYVFSVRTYRLYDLDLNGETRFVADFTSLGSNGGPTPLTSAPAGTLYYLPHGPYSLFRIESGGDPQLLIEGMFGDPVGLAVSPDGLWLYVGESGAINRIRIGE